MLNGICIRTPDSDIDGINIHQRGNGVAKRLREVHIEDVVTGVPDSSISAAIGFSEESGIPYELGRSWSLCRRTFIQPTQECVKRREDETFASASSCER